jgi:hypothetical protein
MWYISNELQDHLRDPGLSKVPSCMYDEDVVGAALKGKVGHDVDDYRKPGQVPACVIVFPLRVTAVCA